MAHYLAELLERAHDPRSTSRARSAARAEIARVVPALWEQQVAREAVHVRQQVDYWLRRTDKLDAEAEELLTPLLAKPESSAGIPESKLSDALRALHALTELATRCLLTGAAAERARTGVSPEALHRFLKRDEELQGIESVLARIVPGFATLDRTDSDAAVTFLHRILLAATRAQLAILERLSPGPLSLPKPRKPGSRKKRA
ncbi:MAG TPA: hypothetical protein VOA80_15155 [Thermoanaerobaculia bacterium]|nr:hypothetical protein [Thermoanaerobaculia bacterium]